jgi:hypothetical protein
MSASIATYASRSARTTRFRWARECVGHFAEPQCQQVCPVDCIPKDPAHTETREQLMQKYVKLTAASRAA